jgi:short-subunit dehydrogenase
MAQLSVTSRKLTWLITGCSSGFGLSLVRQVQTQGHRVIATSRTPSNTPELVAEVEEKGGKWLKLDVTDSSNAEFVTQLEKSGTHIDVLVNNAGFCTFSPVETSSDQDIKDQMEAMYFGPIRLIKAVLPFMREQRFGVIANFSSGAALDGNPTMGPYAGAKAALDGEIIPIYFYYPQLIFNSNHPGSGQRSCRVQHSSMDRDSRDQQHQLWKR